MHAHNGPTDLELEPSPRLPSSPRPLSPHLPSCAALQCLDIGPTSLEALEATTVEARDLEALETLEVTSLEATALER